ncbi:MAG: 50S ribosomal protein L10 [Candidatus Diapherotrites archaeon]|nr:50S ribosomal protein L10 [Candidatus Diapherotrites archaeon]
MTGHTLKWKQARAGEIQKLIDQYPVIALADIQGFPAALFARLRKKLHGKAVVKVCKTQVIKKALLASSKKDSELKDKLANMTAIIFTEMNPFELYAFLKKNKGSTNAKAGQIAPDDILVPAGDTGLPPGPALSDLKAAGLPVKMMGASIHVSADTIVAKKGQPISAPVAGTLSKLNIKPIHVGLNLIAVLEHQMLYPASVLDIDETKVFEQFKTARFHAFNLALNIEYFTPETVELFIQKAHRDSKAVAIEGNVLEPEVIGAVLAKIQRQAEALQALVKEPAASG